jgi:hypothetical protein
MPPPPTTPPPHNVRCVIAMGSTRFYSDGSVTGLGFTIAIGNVSEPGTAVVTDCDRLSTALPSISPMAGIPNAPVPLSTVLASPPLPLLSRLTFSRNPVPMFQLPIGARKGSLSLVLLL